MKGEAKHRRKQKTGAIIVFKPGISPEEAKKLLEELPYLEHADVNTFNPEWGGPVWYVP